MKYLSPISGTVVLIAFLAIFCRCGSNSAQNELPGTVVPLSNAGLLHLSDDGVARHVRVTNPWDTSAVLAQYILVPDSTDFPMPETNKAWVIKTPVKRALVFSSVHASLIEELGASDAIKGVCEPQYFKPGPLKDRIDNGEIIDCGNSMAPDVERILAMEPDVILMAPYENPESYRPLLNKGIPVVLCAEYMEKHPLGRAEWMKFFASVFGVPEKGDSLFRSVACSYDSLRNSVSVNGKKPLVLPETIQSGVWYIPSSNSPTAGMVHDAGGRLPEIPDVPGDGHSPEEVLVAASNADVWILRYMDTKPLSYPLLASQTPMYSGFKPFKERNVFACNTLKCNFYEEMPFHPHWLLANLISIIHPESGIDAYPGKEYYSPLQE